MIENRFQNFDRKIFDFFLKSIFDQKFSIFFHEFFFNRYKILWRIQKWRLEVPRIQCGRVGGIRSHVKKCKKNVKKCNEMTILCIHQKNTKLYTFPDFRNRDATPTPIPPSPGFLSPGFFLSPRLSPGFSEILGYVDQDFILRLRVSNNRTEADGSIEGVVAVPDRGGERMFV